MFVLVSTPVNFVITYVLINLIKNPKVMYRLNVFVSVGGAPTTDGYAFPDNIQLSSDPINLLKSLFGLKELYSHAPIS